MGELERLKKDSAPEDPIFLVDGAPNASVITLHQIDDTINTAFFIDSHLAANYNGTEWGREPDYSKLQTRVTTWKSEWLNTTHKDRRSKNPLVILNREGEWTKDIRRDTSLTSDGRSPVRFAQALAQGKDMVRLTKDIWPEARVGFYDIPYAPYTDFMGTSKTKEQIITELTDFMDVCDWMGPSMYEGTKNQVSLSSERVEQMELSVTLANGKPVYPWIWHRYNTAQLTLMTEVDFETRMREIYEEGATGFIWFNTDRKDFNNGTLLDGITTEADVTSIENTYTQILREVFPQVLTVSRSNIVTSAPSVTI